MKPRTKLAETRTPDGGTLALYEHDGTISMSLNGAELMHSRASASERLLGELGVARIGKDAPCRVLIGGLGLGFTLKRVLETIGDQAAVEVVELLPDVIEWNRDHLSDLHGGLLEDARVQMHAADASAFIRASEGGLYDAILLDIDNGPVAMVNRANDFLYSSRGIKAVRAALKAQGRAIFWSASPDKAFENRLRQVGFSVEAVPAKIHENAKRGAYLLYVADLGLSGD